MRVLLTNHHFLVFEYSALGPLHLKEIKYVEDFRAELKVDDLLMRVFKCRVCGDTRVRTHEGYYAPLFCGECADLKYFTRKYTLIRDFIDDQTLRDVFDYDDNEKVAQMIVEYNARIEQKKKLVLRELKGWVTVGKLPTKKTLLSRDEFREAVFARDNNVCVWCGNLAADAHHLYERKLWSDGGYYVDNGVSLCSNCHYLAEKTEISVEELRMAANIKETLLPPSLSTDGIYDKWGNPFFLDGKRLRGPLFYDENTRKVLDVTDFLPYVKYPRTPHLPWSHATTHQDLTLDNAEHFKGKEVVVTEKLDGQNVTLYADYVHARSITSEKSQGLSRAKSEWAKLSHKIDPNMRINCESLFIEHSLSYHGLKKTLYGFFVWIDNLCVSYDDMLVYLAALDLPTVPLLYRGVYDEAVLKDPSFMDYTKHEGYVVRLADEFSANAFSTSVAKFVRKDHNTLRWGRTERL